MRSLLILLTVVAMCGCDGPDECVLCADGGDGDADGDVDVDDLVEILLQWGTAGSPADLDGNGTVDVDDLIIVIMNWGECNPPV